MRHGKLTKNSESWDGYELLKTYNDQSDRLGPNLSNQKVTGPILVEKMMNIKELVNKSGFITPPYSTVCIQVFATHWRRRLSRASGKEKLGCTKTKLTSAGAETFDSAVLSLIQQTSLSCEGDLSLSLFFSLYCEGIHFPFLSSRVQPW